MTLSIIKQVFMVLVEVMLNFFRKRFTRNYPKVHPGLPENFRGPVKWNKDTCIFCGACARNCPAFAIKIDKDKRQLTIDPYKCISCGLCEEKCPTKPKSIHLTERLHVTRAKGEKLTEKPAKLPEPTNPIKTIKTPEPRKTARIISSLKSLKSRLKLHRPIRQAKETETPKTQETGGVEEK